MLGAMPERILAYQIGKNIEGIRELSDAEDEALTAALVTLRRHELAYQTFIHLAREHESLRERCEHYFSELATGEAPTPGTAHRFLVNQNRHILNILALASAYLEHARRRIRLLFGEPSAQLAAFNALHRRKFADYFPYRFILKLRNYVQHYDLPMCRAKMSAKAIPGTNREISCEVDLLFNRDDLLRGSFNWDALRKDIAAQPDDWSAITTLEDAMLQIQDLHVLAVSFEIDTLRKAASVVEALRKEAETEKGREGCVIYATREGPGSDTAKVEYPSWFLVDMLMERYSKVVAWSA